MDGFMLSRCKSYENAKKKLTVSEAPNILTIALKRFQVFHALSSKIRWYCFVCSFYDICYTYVAVWKIWEAQ